MKVTWYLPAYNEMAVGSVFGGEVVPLFRTSFYSNQEYLAIQDTRRHFNLCRIDYEPGEYTREELDVLANNYKHLAEIQLDNIRNKRESTV